MVCWEGLVKFIGGRSSRLVQAATINNGIGIMNFKILFTGGKHLLSKFLFYLYAARMADRHAVYIIHPEKRKRCPPYLNFASSTFFAWSRPMALSRFLTNIRLACARLASVKIVRLRSASCKLALYKLAFARLEASSEAL